MFNPSKMSELRSLRFWLENDMWSPTGLWNSGKKPHAWVGGMKVLADVLQNTFCKGSKLLGKEKIYMI